ncbi:CobB/CobQ domain protein glutamine amidotransferase [Isosphaera pallida ATCC 43644]|uniref:CobB/CobQ domain protein glutamine amidotransferase n=1 Tax=Isosphaera pallida (strain ATCC 43644 / DSM 9630 / IS1B) TaxID=575540 RepID=E8R610_ISOPI|nr:CobB/CobQ domain-containing protein glutamine amidotransferase [Isosphaera pallida]ADV63912.1 CobB/CobQ domain protein glutamine amidotransferase [Isosphaera pallida ATCC 43644]
MIEHRPRLALSVAEDGCVPSLATLALLAGLSERGMKVQHFRTRSCLTGLETYARATGFHPRHLDPWLMGRETCQAAFHHGGRHADLAVIEGHLPPRSHLYPQKDLPTLSSSCQAAFSSPCLGDLNCPEGQELCDRHEPEFASGGLASLCETLDLPKVAVVSCRGLEGFHLPPLPEGIDAVLLDGLEHPEEIDALRHVFEVFWRLPVLAAIEAFPEFRRLVASDHFLVGRDDELLHELARSFLQTADLDLLHQLIKRPFHHARPFSFIPARQGCFRVALAQDDAFDTYFPDTLEALEHLGADLVEFSPLRDDQVPPDCDLILLGCGHPDQFASELAANLSMIYSLRASVCRGTRLYAEGGGAAWLAEALEVDGQVVPGVGLFPGVVAQRLRTSAGSQRVCRVLRHDTWLGSCGQVVRGYATPHWRFQIHSSDSSGPNGFPRHAAVQTLTCSGDMVGRHRAVASLVHLHLTALPEFLAAFASQSVPLNGSATISPSIRPAPGHSS